MLESFIPAINNLSMPADDRLGLLDDLFAFVKSGRICTTELLKFLLAYKNETDLTVWSAIILILDELENVFSYSERLGVFSRFQQELLAPIFCHLGWKTRVDECYGNTMLRSLILHKLATTDVNNVIGEAKKQFDMHIESIKKIEVDLRVSCYKAVIKMYPNTFDTFLQLYRTAELQEEKIRIITSICVVDDLKLKQKILDFALSSEVRSQDAYLILIHIGASKSGRDLAWQFLTANWEKFIDMYQGGALLDRMVKGTLENFACDIMAKDIQVFFAKHKYPGTKIIINQVIEKIGMNSNWLKRDEENIYSYFKTEWE